MIMEHRNTGVRTTNSHFAFRSVLPRSHTCNTEHRRKCPSRFCACVIQKILQIEARATYPPSQTKAMNKWPFYFHQLTYLRIRIGLDTFNAKNHDILLYSCSLLWKFDYISTAIFFPPITAATVASSGLISVAVKPLTRTGKSLSASRNEHPQTNVFVRFTLIMRRFFPLLLLKDFYTHHSINEIRTIK